MFEKRACHRDFTDQEWQAQLRAIDAEFLNDGLLPGEKNYQDDITREEFIRSFEHEPTGQRWLQQGRRVPTKAFKK